MSGSFNALAYQCTSIGRRIKSSKLKYIWEFSLDDRKFTVELFDSRMSGKRTLLLNGDMKVNTRRRSNAYDCFRLAINGHTVAVYERSDSGFELKCDNVPFRDSFNGALGRDSNRDPFTLQTSLELEENPIISEQRIPVNPPEPEKTELKKESPVLDLLGSEPAQTDAFEDLFYQPLAPQSNVFSGISNPFEHNVSESLLAHPAQNNNNKDLFDLDSLHLGNTHSPAVVKKAQEQYRSAYGAVAEAPGIPMNQLQASAPFPTSLNASTLLYHPYTMYQN